MGWVQKDEEKVKWRKVEDGRWKGLPRYTVRADVGEDTLIPS